ncbi:double-strand break repair protein AddB [Salinarimonas soli]|uniref:Double-strand break repair protein AddB n=1 Tax=Salinarimonas soli TaxID=1638099 RepID=A0A5B2VHD0_9HYPH|nr:double-strand break repair protein AddB [Salinarimonas soli]KAA2237890.1 double-strand break repair protein AddB [Salinarimonas soli]
MAEPTILTIPPGVPFLPALADALLDGRLIPGFPDPADPLALAGAVIYLPTRRAARALAALLAERAGEGAVLLPRIVPLGEADAAEMDLAAGAFEAHAADALLPAVAPIERRLVLTRLIQLWARQVDRALLRLEPDAPCLVPGAPADAVKLAADLEGLMDALTTEGVPWINLAGAVEGEYSRYFGITLDFARIAAEFWPAELAERDASDPTDRRTRVIELQAERLRVERPRTPIVIAGSTGSIPATAALIRAVASLPRGAVVLPGLDHDLDPAGWAAIGASTDPDCVHGHPQAVLRRLVDEHLRLARDAVRPLGTPDETLAARARLLSQALRPAETTEAWAAMPGPEREALAQRGCEGLSLVEAADEREEALAIAVAMRETLTVPGRTAALVTPDRSLAARVAAELGRWGIKVDDSAGMPLGDAEAGRLARLAAEAAAGDFAPWGVLALLAHPAVRLGLERRAVEHAAAVLEIGVLRGPRPGPGFAGLNHALQARRGKPGGPLPRRRLDEADWAACADLLQRLEYAFGSFTPAAKDGDAIDLRPLAAEHRRTVDDLARGPDDEAPWFPDGSGEALAALFDDLDTCDPGPIEGRFADYPAFFATLARERPVTAPTRAVHRRLKILGLLEARLLTADRIVLGGLDEGVWPPRVETDAFLNRPMRHAVGLGAPERRIGQSAHDFVQALGIRDAVVTRAIKRDGSPTVPSRFLQRLKAFAGPDAWTRMTARGARHLDLGRVLDTAEPEAPLARPRPLPDPALFPQTFSVTEIETLVRDPYAVFARRILRLDALDPVAAPPGAAERGTLIHGILAAFVAACPGDPPADALARLLSLGDEAFAEVRRAFPEVYAEWWPRFERLAGEFCRWERARRPAIAAIHPERSGALAIPLPDGRTITLRARADRIEEGRDGGLTIVDFKTGAPPGTKEICAGFSPQMTLEGAMLRHGAFAEVPAAADTPGLLYVQVSGGSPPLREREVEPRKGETLGALIDEHERRLRGLLARYASGEAAYLSRPFPKSAKRVSDYDHLARVKEWSAASAGGFEGDGA